MYTTGLQLHDPYLHVFYEYAIPRKYKYEIDLSNP